MDAPPYQPAHAGCSPYKRFSGDRVLMSSPRPIRLTACGLVVTAILAVKPVHAASPALGGTTPRGAQRGTEVEVVFSGAQLDDSQEILFYEPGIEVAKLEVVNPTTVKVLFKIAPDCTLGSHRLRVRTATGVSDLRPFFVGALPEVAEKEPNSDFTAPQPIPMNVTVNGTADNEDVDYFVVEAK